LSAQAAGASPLFPPHHQDAQEAKQAVLDQLHRGPEASGQAGTRWTLASIRGAIGWMGALSLSGVWRVLRRLEVGDKRGRDYLHSPDPDYDAKLEAINCRLREARASGGKVVVLFCDELSFYRQPTVARDYEARGRKVQPRARRGYARDESWREVGAVDALTGRVVHRQASKVSIATVVKFYQQVRETFPEAEQIYMAEDNWSMHFHPDVLAALKPQETPFPMTVPASWPKEASRKAKRLNLPIQILPQPTYAPWTNPIERLWKLTKQEKLHMHRKAEQWGALKRDVCEFLDGYAKPSPDLLRYIGLTPRSTLYGAALFPGLQESDPN
jgi:hypothetical protein